MRGKKVSLLVGGKSFTCTLVLRPHRPSAGSPTLPLNVLASTFWHFGSHVPLSRSQAALAGWDRTGVSWRRWPVEYLPTLSFSLGPSVGPPCVLCPARAPARGERGAGRARYPARPLLCWRSLISALHTAHWAHPFPGVLGPGGGGEGVDILYIGVFPNLPLLSRALVCFGTAPFHFFSHSSS